MKRLKSTRLYRLLPALFAGLALQAVAGMVWGAQPITRIHDIGAASITISASAQPEDWLIIGNTTTNNITVTTTFNGTITLKDVTITYAYGQWKNAIDIQDNAHVTLKLMGTNNITSVTRPGIYKTDNGKAVIRVNTGAYLTIESYNGETASGILNVTQAFGGSNGQGGAAIGSNYSEHNGHITINSGTVNARGGDDCAGIGGGSSGAGGWITINGGKVIGNCDSHEGDPNSGAGIGAGYNCSNTDTYIRITGGDVTAISLLKPTQDNSGSAIGTGNNCSGFGYIIITGGTVRASVRSLFNDAGEPVHPDIPKVLAYNDTLSGIDGLKYTSEHVGGLVGTSNLPKGYEGRRGCGIGGGAAPTGTSGTIIILPSANVQRVYGGVYDTNDKDIGNCSNLFYLNKTPLRVGLASGVTPVNTKNFTVRTSNYHVNADMFVHVPDADTHIGAVAAKIGMTAGDGILGRNVPSNSGDTLKYYTNVTVSFFTGATPASGFYYDSVMPIGVGTNNLNDLNANPTDAPYNPSSGSYNVILPTNSSPAGNFKLSDGWGKLPLPSESPILLCDQESVTLNFGSATYHRTGPVLTSGSRNAMAFSIKNTESLWLDIRIDSANTNIRYFDLDGPVVSPPSVEGGANLPVGTTGTITATLKPQVPVGLLIDTLTLKATIPGTTTTITRTVYLQINVSQQAVSGQSEAWVIAKNPAPPVLPTDTVKTNATTVRLNARAGMPSVDGVETVWYKISTNPAESEENEAAGYVPSSGVNGWKDTTAIPVNGKLGYSFLFEADFPTTDAVYYIHWFVETVNTIGSRSGVIGPYDVRRNNPIPVISGVTSIGVAPVTLTIQFNGNPLETGTSLTTDMFSVTNCTVSNITPDGPNQYKFDVVATGAGDVEITFPQNQVRDEYGNRNVTSVSYTLAYSNGIPRADFTGTDSVYFTQPSAISFGVSSGLNDQRLFQNNATTQITDGSTAASTFTITPAISGTSIAFTSAPPRNEFKISGLSNLDGAYTIHIPADSIKNELGSGILDTTYTFKIYKLALSIASSHTFPTKNEGYPALTPEVVTITNSGTLTATGLTATLSGANATDFAISAPAATLPGSGSITSFTVAPVTGLMQGTYTATVIVWSHGNEVGSFTVSFTVTRIPPPNALIDFVNETFTNLSADTTYVFNGGSPVAPDETGAVPISERWMTGTTNGLSVAKIDSNYSVPGAAQQITVPPRPAAPAIRIQHASRPNVNDGMITGVNDLMEYRAGETGEWIAVPTGITWLDDLTPGIYQVRYRAIAGEAFASHIAVATVFQPTDPVLLREVTLPETPGITVLPYSGLYYINSGESFPFTLLFEGDTPPTVRTNRIVDGRRETLTGVPNGAGGYDYLIPAVRETIVVEITPHDVAAEAVDGTSVWAYGNAIRIESPQRTTADIYSVSGLLLQRIEVAPGLTTLQAAHGVYLVVLPGGATYKVTVK